RRAQVRRHQLVRDPAPETRWNAGHRHVLASRGRGGVPRDPARRRQARARGASRRGRAGAEPRSPGSARGARDVLPDPGDRGADPLMDEKKEGTGAEGAMEQRELFIGLVQSFQAAAMQQLVMDKTAFTEKI